MAFNDGQCLIEKKKNIHSKHADKFNVWTLQEK